MSGRTRMARRRVDPRSARQAYLVGDGSVEHDKVARALPVALRAADVRVKGGVDDGEDGDEDEHGAAEDDVDRDVARLDEHEMDKADDDDVGEKAEHGEDLEGEEELVRLAQLKDEGKGRGERSVRP